MSESELTCPFCMEDDFDKIGLKKHLLAGYCDAFNLVESEDEEKERKESQPSGEGET